MHKITTTDDMHFEVECIACSIAKGEIDVIGDIIDETNSIFVSSDAEYPIPGFLILSSKRHVRSIAEFTLEECHELAELVHHSRLAMQKVSGIEKVTLIQEEKSNNSHFHLWLFPWYDWMGEVGEKLSSIRDIMEYSLINHKTPDMIERIKDESQKLRKFMKESRF